MPTPSRPIRPRFAAIVLALLACAGVPALQAQQPERHLLAGPRIAVYSLVGETRVEAGSGRDVEVEVVRGGRHADRIRVESGRVHGEHSLRVVVSAERVVYPRMSRGSRTQLRVHDDGTFGGRAGGRRVTVAGSGAGVEAFADLRVRVPAGRSVVVHQGAGSVRVSNVEGDLRVQGSAASVETRATRGSLAVNLGSGRVQVHDAVGDVDVDTGSGSVEISGIRGSRARIDTGSGAVRGSGLDVGELHVDTGSGSVRLSEVRIRDGVVDTGSGSVRLGLVAPLRSLRVDTGSGAVAVGLPRAAGAELDIRTGSGGISVDAPLHQAQRDRRSLRGRIGDGNASVRIRTGSGGVRIAAS